MAVKSLLLLLALVTMAVFTSAHRPLAVDKHEVSERPITQKKEPEETHITRNKMAINDEKGDELDNVGQKMGDDDGKVRPKPINPSNLRDELDNVGKKMGDDDGKVRPKPINPSNLGISLTTIPIQGPDGGFHIQLGPFGIGFDIGGGGVLQLPPGYSPGPYTPPYVVVSQYSLPYGQPMQYHPYMIPNQQIGSVVGPPAHGSNDRSPSQGYSPRGSLQKGTIGSPGTRN